jgi:uncharacterized membrane protein YhhN
MNFCKAAGNYFSNQSTVYKMDILKFLHSANIAIHITAGSLALLLGVVALSSKKGKQVHTKSGRWFLLFLLFVIVTGLLGVFVFGRNTFLLVITLLSGYYGFSGYRVLQTKSNQPVWPDIAAAIICLLAAAYFLYYFKTIKMIWVPVIIYSTVVTLMSVIAYDFIRYLIPASRYKNLWLYEHIVKMIGAFTALLAAFTGTVFAAYQPYSQILPSAFGIVLQIGFIIYYYRRNNKKQVSGR